MNHPGFIIVAVIVASAYLSGRNDESAHRRYAWIAFWIVLVAINWIVLS